MARLLQSDHCDFDRVIHEIIFGNPSLIPALLFCKIQSVIHREELD